MGPGSMIPCRGRVLVFGVVGRRAAKRKCPVIQVIVCLFLIFNFVIFLIIKEK